LYIGVCGLEMQSGEGLGGRGGCLLVGGEVEEVGMRVEVWMR
jgi:hypothetical protein